MNFRTEHDFLGKEKIPQNALYGIHSFRAKKNFPDNTPFFKEWYKAVGIVKLACYQTYKRFKQAAVQKYSIEKFNDINIHFLEDKIINALIAASEEVAQGSHFENFIVPAVQGGAGTSINMNVNEIIANKALLKIGNTPGNYQLIDPIESANIFQSTNDVIPTALKIAIISQLEILEKTINDLRFVVERLENKHRYSLRIAYTQIQQAVPSSFGKLFSSYNDALSRDWWRVSKCFERIKVVNIGGGAIGTGLSIPRYFIMEVVNELQKLTQLPITKSENMVDTTCNLDVYVEIHAILKAHAVNLEKIASDMRLLSSNLLEQNEISIPKKQVGSSIMPGKVNPVISEFVISSAHKIYANDLIISNLSAQGNLELNAYLPIIGHSILDSLNLLIAANRTLNENLFKELKIDTKKSLNKLYSSPSITTALSPYIGYHKASEMAKKMETEQLTIFEANNALKLIDAKKIKQLLEPQNLLKAGFTLKELFKE